MCTPKPDTRNLISLEQTREKERSGFHGSPLTSTPCCNIHPPPILKYMDQKKPDVGLGSWYLLTPVAQVQGSGPST